jgi:hypothetical protein
MASIIFMMMFAGAVIVAVQMIKPAQEVLDTGRWPIIDPARYPKVPVQVSQIKGSEGL